MVFKFRIRMWLQIIYSQNLRIVRVILQNSGGGGGETYYVGDDQIARVSYVLVWWSMTSEAVPSNLIPTNLQERLTKVANLLLKVAQKVAQMPSHQSQKSGRQLIKK